MLAHRRARVQTPPAYFLGAPKKIFGKCFPNYAIESPELSKFSAPKMVENFVLQFREQNFLVIFGRFLVESEVKTIPNIWPIGPKFELWAPLIPYYLPIKSQNNQKTIKLQNPKKDRKKAIFDENSRWEIRFWW